MNTKISGIRAIMAATLLAASAWAGDVTDAALGYTITLPTGWQQIKTKATQHHFRDTTKQCKSVMSIVQYPIDKILYPDARSWTQTQFIGYKLAVETSEFPFGAVLFFDSSSTAKLGEQWAPEMFSQFFPGDGGATYGEYLRYSAFGDFGYEIYAIGDSTDITSKADFYAGVIATLKFSASSIVSLRRTGTALRTRARSPIGAAVFDVTGRQVLVPALETAFPGEPAMRPFRFLVRPEGD